MLNKRIFFETVLSLKALRSKPGFSIVSARERGDRTALLTAVGDVEASAGHGVISLELQLQDVGVAGEV